MSNCETSCKDVPEFVQGEKIRLLIEMIDEDNKAVDLTGATQIQALFPSIVKGEYIRKTLLDASDPITVVDTTKAKVVVPPALSKNILAESRLSVIIAVDFADDKGRQIDKVEDALSVCALGFDLDSAL